MQCNRPQSKNVCIFVQIEKYLHFWGFRGCLSQIMTLVSGGLKSKNVCCGGLLAMPENDFCVVFGKNFFEKNHDGWGALNKQQKCQNKFYCTHF